MALPELLSAQRDFSAGELDPEMKRRDDLPIYKAGGRQMRDWRILNSGLLEQRPGRRALYLQGNRIDQIAVSPTQTFDLCFGGDGSWAIRDSTGAVVASRPAGTYVWSTDTVKDIVWTKLTIGATRTDVVACLTGAPAVASFDSATGAWTFFSFAFATDASGSALPPFFRVAAPGATMQPSATAPAGGVFTIAFSADVLLAAHGGVLFRFAGRRFRATIITDARHATCNAIDALLPTQQLTLTAPDGTLSSGVAGFALGQVVQGNVSGATGEVVGINVGANTIAVQLTNYDSGFIVSGVVTELVIGPSARSKVAGVVNIAPLPAVSWDEQMFSDARGWPASCATDDSRLIFCDMPSTPSGIAWSRTGSPYDFTVGPNATDAIVELIAGKPRVYHVAPWLDELVFTDLGLYFIPINTTNPLRPGSVQFKFVSPEVASRAKPLFTSDGYLYVNAGQNSIKAVVPDGSSFSTKPYSVTDVTTLHQHLFVGGPVALALATGDGQKPERYVYVVNADGSVVVGKYEAAKQWIGWVPWPAPSASSGSGAIKWVSALHSAVRFTTIYPVQGVPAGVSVGEVLDHNQYVDGAILINSPPVGMTTPGKGPFYWIRLGQIELMDGVMPLGTHAIDVNGNIIPAYQGEDLSSATIIGGLGFEPMFEPFIPNSQPGQDQGQRSMRRNLGRMIVSVQNSTGFVMASLYSGPDGPNQPTQGAIQKTRRIPPWNQGDNQANAPTLREATYRQRFSGRAFDQRVSLFKDKPGPLRVVEVAIEASV